MADIIDIDSRRGELTDDSFLFDEISEQLIQIDMRAEPIAERIISAIEDGGATKSDFKSMIADIISASIDIMYERYQDSSDYTPTFED